jgi:hypothetical protein
MKKKMQDMVDVLEENKNSTGEQEKDQGGDEMEKKQE